MSEVRIPEGTRWSCQSCASCCHGLDYGPVEPEVMARLHAAPIEVLWPKAADGWCHERHSQGASGWFLDVVDGHCIFLQDDKLCAIHAQLGVEAKPGFCREFPIQSVRDPRGLVGIVRPECAGFFATFEQGPQVTKSDVEQAAALPRLAPRGCFEPDAVAVIGRRGVGLDDWMRLEELILDRLDGPTESDAVVAIRGLLDQAMGLGLPAPQPGRDLHAARAVIEAITSVLERAVQQPGGREDQRSFLRTMVTSLRATRTGLAAPLPLMTADANAWRLLQLRGELMAKRVFAQGDLASGLGLFLLDGVVCRATASDPVDPRSVSAVLVPWLRLRAIGAVQQILRRAQPALLDLFLHAQ